MTCANAKILRSWPALSRTARAMHAAGQRIVVTNGCYDLLHVGHVRALAGARRRGDCLVVGVNTDASARQNKGPGHPIVPEAERAEMLAAIRWVDCVFVFADKTADRLLVAVRPHAYCKGTEYTIDTIPERDTVRQLGARFYRVGDPKDHSTTDLIQRTVRLHGRRAGRGAGR